METPLSTLARLYNDPVQFSTMPALMPPTRAPWQEESASATLKKMHATR
jgi:hypothetical protein